ncbi:MAG: HesA/MoeB/ThiF family protein [Chitinophagales bacterium]
MINYRYKRQSILKEVGACGQQKLLDTKVLIIGCGGLGGEVAVHLAAAGVGEIHLIDFDVVDETNLHRQVFFNENDIRKSKADTLKKYISNQNSKVKIIALQERITKLNVVGFISKVDYVFDCTDDLLTKYLINDACVLNNKLLIYGSLFKFEGHVSVFNHHVKNANRNCNLRDVFPEIPKENIPSCSEVGTLNSIVAIIANMQVNELYKLVLGIGKPLVNQLLIFNSLDNEILKLQLKVNEELNFKKLWKTNTYVKETCENDKDLEISLDELKAGNYKIISLVENLDFDVFLYTSLKEIKTGNLKLEVGNYCIVCEKGISSLKAVKILKKQFPLAVFKSLKSGLINFHKGLLNL